jgi:hypothetical protein
MMSKVSLGNIQEAQTHQLGLLTLAENLGLSTRDLDDVQEELMHRYVIM